MSKFLKETDIIQYWKEINAFQKSLELTEQYPKFKFYDGPPFATGLPHYGHIVASTLKDIIPRYKAQNGYYVERVFGWDTHGLPIEYEIEKKLGIKTKQQVIDFGIANYNEECRKIVLKFRDEWRTTIERLGRWVDFDNDYKTMDTSFMQSVWWVFGELYKKNLIYRGVKVMPYSNGCTTPLSQSEASDNYKNVPDPSLTIQIKIDIPKLTDTYLLVWTTTPWTLVSNLALCVNPKLDYCQIEFQEKKYLIAKECISRNFKVEEVKVLQKFNGKELLGIEYQPLYPYFEEKYQGFRILNDTYVESGSGTGIVHIAPAFGKDDYRVCMENNIISKDNIPPCPLDPNGYFTDDVVDFKGKYIKDADKIIIKDLKSRGMVFSHKSENHEYPFCWRSNTPLIYKAVPSWFVRVEEFKDRISEKNLETSWTPKQIRDNKFGSWLKGSMDWCISRSRYWGTPIPIWTTDDYSEMICISSIQELEEKAGLEKGSITDLHKHNIDHITIMSKETGKVLRRIPEVFDCWFESGSMPYAQKGYPFTEQKLEDIFPADFIAEGTDQTRGWFYTLMILSTALFDRPAFKNVIVNGLVLASDGEKMSKSKKNYPPVNGVFEKYGADAVRLYLIGSPVVRAGNLKFKEADIRTINKNIILKMYDIMKYLQLLIDLYEDKSGSKFCPLEIENIEREALENWLLEYTNQFIKDIHTDMDKYDLYRIGDKIEDLIDKLSRGYINMDKCRRNLKDTNDLNSISVFFYCLYHLVITMAPFTPFLSESIYQRLKNYYPGPESVHFIQMKKLIWQGEGDLISSMESLMAVNDAVRIIRTKKMQRGFRMPVNNMIIVNSYNKKLTDLKKMENLLKEVVNVMNISYTNEESKYVTYQLQIKSELGKLYKQNMRPFNKYLKEMTLVEVEDIVKTESDVIINDEVVPYKNLSLQRNLIETDNMISYLEGDFVVLMDTEVTQEMRNIQECKLMVRFLQDFRKECKLVHTDKIKIYYNLLSGDLNEVKGILSEVEEMIGNKFILTSEEIKIDNKEHKIYSCSLKFYYEKL